MLIYALQVRPGPLGPVRCQPTRSHLAGWTPVLAGWTPMLAGETPMFAGLTPISGRNNRLKPAPGHVPFGGTEMKARATMCVAMQ
jgi:hypothetical protein